MPVDPLLREVIVQFVDEAAERAAVVARCVLTLEKTGGGDDDRAEAWTRLKRELHTLKGSAATAGLDEPAAVAHRLESAIAGVARERALPASIASELLQGVDAFVALVRAEIASWSANVPRSTDGGGELDAGTAADDDEESAWRVRSDDVLAFTLEIERLRELRLRLDERVREIDAAMARLATPLARDELAGVRRALTFDSEETGEIIAALEERVKAICTLPLRTILEPLHRVVRDVAAASGKRAALSIVGDALAIDRRLLERLRGSLIQLVRNAVDHGIENPDERVARGKHDAGSIVVRAEQEGNMLFLEIADDGAGMSEQRILREAGRLGLVDDKAAASLTQDEVLKLAFHQGLSTKSAVSATSGRGVGLDIVAKELRALHGTIDVTSVPGQGTRIVLHLPIDLGSSAILLVRVGEHVLGVPMLAVEGITAATPATALHVDGALHVVHHDRRLALHDLGAVLGTRSASMPAPNCPLVVVHDNGRRLAFSVDAVVGDRDLVVRPLPSSLAELPAYQGAAVLARGELVLVLRPDWLASRDALPLVPPARRRVLVVDDSLTARALHRTILEAGGYDVHAVASVELAEEELRRGRYDVVVCDFTFAQGMKDGLDLLRALRASSSSAAVRGPAFVLVSMTDEHGLHTRATEYGCDAFLTKQQCAAGRLLAEVSTVLTRTHAAVRT